MFKYIYIYIYISFLHTLMWHHYKNWYDQFNWLDEFHSYNMNQIIFMKSRMLQTYMHVIYTAWQQVLLSK